MKEIAAEAKDVHHLGAQGSARRRGPEFAQMGDFSHEWGLINRILLVFLMFVPAPLSCIPAPSLAELKQVFRDLDGSEKGYLIRASPAC